jgi:plasmid maintenance system antidote protein VapI
MSEGYWLNLQKRYEADCVHADTARITEIDAITPLERPDLEDAAA